MSSGSSTAKKKENVAAVEEAAPAAPEKEEATGGLTLEDLAAEIFRLKEELKKAKEEKVEATAAPAAPANAQEVTIVYLSDNPGVINRVPNLELECSYYGETFTLPRYQFDALVGKYRHWFQQGILAVSRDNLDVAATKGLPTEDEFYLKPSMLAKMGKMSVNELRQMWDKCVNDNERLSIVFYFKRKFIEGKDPAFRDPEKVLLLNQLTNQGLKREALEISGASLKISQTNF